METKDKKRRSALCVAPLHRVLLQRNAPLLNKHICNIIRAFW